MNSRRKFLKNLTAVGATVPLVSNIEAKPKKNKGPVILCSRGEIWGEKVLKPGWDILSNKGKLWTWTVQRFLPKTPYIEQVAPEDFKPYAVGYIELPGEIMVESRLVGIDPKELEIGMEMELTIEPFVKNEEGEELLIFAFKPSVN